MPTGPCIRRNKTAGTGLPPDGVVEKHPMTDEIMINFLDAPGRGKRLSVRINIKLQHGAEKASPELKTQEVDGET